MSYAEGLKYNNLIAELSKIPEERLRSIRQDLTDIIQDEAKDKKRHIKHPIEFHEKKLPGVDGERLTITSPAMARYLIDTVLAGK